MMLTLWEMQEACMLLICYCKSQMPVITVLNISYIFIVISGVFARALLKSETFTWIKK